MKLAKLAEGEVEGIAIGGVESIPVPMGVGGVGGQPGRTKSLESLPRAFDEGLLCRPKTEKEGGGVGGTPEGGRFSRGEVSFCKGKKVPLGTMNLQVAPDGAVR